MTHSEKKVDCYSQVFEETMKMKCALNRYLVDSTKIEGIELMLIYQMSFQV